MTCLVFRKSRVGGLLPVIVVAILISLTSQQRPIKLNCPLDLGVFLDVFQDKFKGTWDFRKIKDVWNSWQYIV